MTKFYLVQVIPGLKQNTNGSYYIVVRTAGAGGAGVLYAPTRSEDEAQQWADSLPAVITVSKVGGFLQLEDSSLAAQYVQLGMAKFEASLPKWEENEAKAEVVEITEATEAGQQPA